MDAANSTRSTPRIIGRPFERGRSGNPLGRPRAALDVQQIARQHTAAAIQALLEALRDPRLKVQAAQALLDRAWGKPIQPVSGEVGNSLGAQHLLAAQLISRDLILERDSQPAAAPAPQPPTLDLLSLPPPSE